MSASDHLNEQQFMHVGDVGRLRSFNSPSGTVKDWDATYRAGNSRNGQPADYAHLDADVAEHGVQQAVTISRQQKDGGPRWLLEGHHRYSAAVAGNQLMVPVRYPTPGTLGDKDDYR